MKRSQEGREKSKREFERKEKSVEKFEREEVFVEEKLKGKRKGYRRS